MMRLVVLTVFCTVAIASDVIVHGNGDEPEERETCDAFIYKQDPCDLDASKVPECDTMCFPKADCSEAGTVLCGKNWGLYKDDVLRIHNTLRQQVAAGKEKRGSPGPQPKGYNIYELKWDDGLAKYAQRWVEQQKKGHDCGACRKPNGMSGTGQNCAYSGSTMASPFPDWLGAINGTEEFPGWFYEVTDFDGPNMRKAGTATTGHYEQVVWGETKLIGCAVYSNNKPCTYINSGWGIYKCQMYACNYYPGRSSSTQPYSTDPADECANKSEDYPNLCVD